MVAIVKLHQIDVNKISYGNMKVTNWLSSRVFSLPMHTELSTLQQDYIIENISNFLKKIFLQYNLEKLLDFQQMKYRKKCLAFSFSFRGKASEGTKQAYLYIT